MNDQPSEDDGHGDINLDIKPDYHNRRRPIDVRPTPQEILEQASYLGINSETESDLLWIAEESWLSDLPEPWVPIEDDKQRIYFYNTKTKQSMWEHPYDDYYSNMVQQERAGRLSRITNSSPEDSGIACVTGSSVRSTPLQPISKPSKSLLPRQLSIDFLSTSPLKIPDKVITSQSTSKSIAASMNNPVTPLNVSSYELSSDFGKNRFLKVDRSKSSSNDEQEIKQESSSQESPKVKFNLDLDMLSDTSHYSYVETEESDSDEMDMMDAAELMQALDTSGKTMVSMLPPQLSDESDAKVVPQLYERPTVIPQNYNSWKRSQDTDSKLEKQPSSNDKSSADKQASLDNSLTSNNTNAEELKSMENKFLEEKVILENKHKQHLEDDQKKYREVENTMDATLKQNMNTLKMEHELKLEQEQEALSTKLLQEIQSIESKERAKLTAEYNDKMSSLKELHQKNLTALESQLSMELEEFKKQNCDNIQHAKGKLSLELEQELQNLRKSHNDQMISEKERLATESSNLKSAMMRANNEAVAKLQTDCQLQLDQLKDQFDQQKNELSNAILTQEEEWKLQQQSEKIRNESEMNIISKKIKDLKVELEQLKLLVAAEKKTLELLHEKQTKVENIKLPDPSSPEVSVNHAISFDEKAKKVGPRSHTLQRSQQNNSAVCDMCRNHLDDTLEGNIGQPTCSSPPCSAVVKDDDLCRKHRRSDKFYVQEIYRNPLADYPESTEKLLGNNYVANINKLMEPVHKELLLINSKISELQNQTTRATPKRVDPSSPVYSDTTRREEDERNGHRLHSSRVKVMSDGEVPQLATSLLEISGQLTDLLSDLRTSTPLTRSAPLNNTNIHLDMPKLTPNIPPMPSFLSVMKEAQPSALLSRPASLADSLSLASSSPLIHEPGSYSSQIYPYTSLRSMESRRFNSAYQAETQPSTRQQLDTQKQWLRDYHKHRQQLPSFI